MSSLVPLFGALATAVAAFLAAVIALVNMLNSKDQKTTEFRQAWINGLRGHITDFAAQARLIAAAVQTAKRYDPNVFTRDSKAYESYSSNRELISTAYYAIRLHFKPGDPDLRKLEGPMNKILSLLSKPSSLEFSKITPALDELTDESRRILKKEWTRVKAGENTYRFTRYAALLIVITSLTGAVFLGWRVTHPTVAARSTGTGGI